MTWLEALSGRILKKAFPGNFLSGCLEGRKNREKSEKPENGGSSTRHFRIHL